ncbi:ABC transporter substrate-binding protein [Paenibacillus antri]|uniref:ABC transporter substrate-binding protein n=1 Tax=Paenibacillus antri TaxID=2582848 RepID=A0A5R9GFS1_9BACL|nr:ABC transporter substrate-binding protein [Paenibacillus antri]TLS54039.1 ABC transporter substrate-binding protein [Paenibacillus antri]
MKKRSLSRWGTRASAIALLLLAACGGQGGANESASEPAAAGAAESGEVLTIALSQDVDTFDTHNTTAISTEAVMVNLQSYLLKRDHDSKVQPHLAESYESVDDVTWAFALKEGITFHNGDPLTSEDVKFSLERVALDNKLVQHQNYKTIKEVEIIDETRFNIITNGPDPVLPYRIAREASGIFPKKYIEEVGWEGYLKHPVGSGPYEFVEWRKGDRLVLSKYDDYFAGDVAQWDTVVFRTIIENSTRIGEALTGGVDIASNIPPTDLERVENNDGTTIVPNDTTTVMMLMVNQNPEFKTSDPKVREAIDYAIDKQALIDKFTDGTAAPTRTRIVPGVPGFEESLYNTSRYDPERTRQLLEEAGYGEGNPLEITYTASQGRSYADSEMAQMITGMLEAAGIKVNLQLLEASQYVDVRTNGKNAELLGTGWNNTMFDPSLALIHFHSTYNPKGFGYNNPLVDELLDRAAVNMNPEERAEQYKEVQRIAAEELPYIYLYRSNEYYSVGDDIEFTPRVDSMFYVEEIKSK